MKRCTIETFDTCTIKTFDTCTIDFNAGPFPAEAERKTEPPHCPARF